MGIGAEGAPALGIGAEGAAVELEAAVEPEAADGAAVEIEEAFLFKNFFFIFNITL